MMDLVNMETGWDYTDLSAIAKYYGGPDAYVDMVYTSGFKDGAILTGIAAVALFGLNEFRKAVKKDLAERRAKKLMSLKSAPSEFK